MGISLEDYIVVLDGALPSAICDEVVRRFDVCPEVIEGKVGLEQGMHVPDFRSCLEMNVTKSAYFADIHNYLVAYIQSSVQRYRDCVKDKGVLPSRFGFEHLRIKKYRSGPGYKDQFREHVDVDSLASAKRFLACFYYLNDVEQGGETRFTHLNLDIQPRKGRVVMFPPLWLFLHSGEIPLSGDKYLLGSYLNYV